MLEQPGFTIEIRAAYALWPGDGVFCIRISGEHLATQFVLVDRDAGGAARHTPEHYARLARGYDLSSYELEDMAGALAEGLDDA